ncbi:MAG: carbohydrate porin [Phycisphaerales bacterium]
MSGPSRIVAMMPWVFVASWLRAEPPMNDPDPVPENIASAPTTDVFDLIAPVVSGGVPQTVPGTQLGPRSRAEEEAPPEVTEPGEWFGGLSYWEWKRLTGDWAGARTWLEEHGVTIESSFTIEWGDAISGGVGHKWVTRNYFDFNATFDTEKLFEWKGGTFYVDVASSNTPYDDAFVPVVQLTSNLEIDGNTFQIANLWYEQKLFDDLLRMKFGKIDASLEFGYLEAAQGFLNVSALLPTTMYTIPWYPYSGLGGLAFLYPCDSFYIGGGAFDANDQPAQFLHDDPFNQVWAVGETGLTWKQIGSLRDGRVSVGGWWDSRELDRFDGAGVESPWGVYAVGQQRLWVPDESADASDERGLWIFGQWGYANEDVSALSMNYGGGISLHGTLPSRDLDVTGFYVSSVQFPSGSGASGNETALEAFYRLAITPAVAFTPDLQYVVNPSGDRNNDDALVLTLRLEMSF